jgi:hypothetical protein
MRVVIIGNSGSGKSTLALHLASSHCLPMLDLDTVAWEPDKIAAPRTQEAATADMKAFCEANRDWVIEGCYTDLVQAACSSRQLCYFWSPAWRPACPTAAAALGSRTSTTRGASRMRSWSFCFRGFGSTTCVKAICHWLPTKRCLMLTRARSASSFLELSSNLSTDACF